MSDPRPASSKAAAVAAIPVWQKALLVIAAVSMVVGCGLQAVQWFGGDDTPTPAATPDPAPPADDPDRAPRGIDPQGFAPQGFLPVPEDDETPPADAPETDADRSPDAPPTALETWSPFFFKLGFSFFLGFTVGFMLRTFLKIGLVFVGLIFFGLMFLQYQGIIEVNWNILEGGWDDFTGWLQGQTGDFAEFIRGSLPSAGSLFAGLAIGFKKK